MIARRLLTTVCRTVSRHQQSKLNKPICMAFSTRNANMAPSMLLQHQWRRPFSAPAPPSQAEIEERVLGVLREFDRVKKENVSLDAKFSTDLGLDSLDVVEVMIALEEEFHMEIPDEVADKVTSPREAVQYIIDTQLAN